MANCLHCGTPFAVAAKSEERFCCKGCEFVHELIHDEGLDRYYTLRNDTPVKPVRGIPFEAHDFTWLSERVGEMEADKEPGARVEGDFSLDGISCIGCVWLVEKIFLRQPGALEAAAHPATGRVHFCWRAGVTDLPGFARELVSFGYTLSARRSGNGVSESGQLGARLGLCGAFMLNAMGFTLPSYLGMPSSFAFSGLFQLVGLLTATLSMLVGGSYFIKRAWQAARMQTLHIDLPIALGLILAYIGSIIGWALEIHGLMYFDFVCTFVFLMLAGRYFQLSSMERNRRRLQRQRPVPETLRSPDQVERLSLAEITAGCRFELEPGQAAPVSAMLDGEAADFSLEWISGEAESQLFPVGRPLPAGAIYLGKSPVVMKALETWAESMLARLVANDRPAVRVPGLEKLLRYYLLVVLMMGVAGFLWWNAHHGAAAALQVMISVFVVSCPCALGVSLPMADEIAGAMMEKLGVFIRQPLLWSRLRRVKTLIFDKTGTLTLERPKLINTEAIDHLTGDARLALARLTAGSLHPVSRTLLEALGKEGQRLLREDVAVSIIDVPGEGRYYEDDGVVWSLGKPAWKSTESASNHDAELCCAGKVVSHFIFKESLRADAITALAELGARGMRRVMLSGDRPEKVAAVAKSLGISPADAHASLLPMEKEAIVRELDLGDTLYLGDGANDSLAFNAAWTTGTPVVDRSLLETKADFYFMGQSLGFLPQLFDVAKRRWQVVRVAFAFALLYNLTVVAICLYGQMSPLLAAILMPLSSIISLVIVGVGMRWTNPPDRKVDLQRETSYSGSRKLSDLPQIMSREIHEYDNALLEKVRHSTLFETYQDAFRSATGLPLRLVGANVEQWCLDEASENRSPFCETLNLCKSACAACIETNQKLMVDAAANGPTTCHCFAGLTATAVPVRAGSQLIGFLKTGQVFNRVPAPHSFQQVSKTLLRQGLSEADVGKLSEAYEQTRSVEPERYQSMVTLLATFAMQLGTQAEKLIVVQDGSEPPTIGKARAFIEENLADPLPLALVARKAGVSESHFCRIFREGTGLTLTDYVNRRRIQWAKKELLKSETRVSEIAFKIGYQSLSQFNRSFARVTGRSPTRFRAEELLELTS